MVILIFNKIFLKSENIVFYLKILKQYLMYAVSPPITREIISKNKQIAKWTLSLFLERAKVIHGDYRFDYTEITEKHIKGQKSCVPITCIICNYSWTPRITDHINKKSGCLDCAGVAPWTLKRFLQWALEINDEMFDYLKITPEHIKGKDSHVPIKCNTCDYEWEPTIHDHINHKNGCPDCSGKAPWNLKRFLVRAFGIHGSLYDYSKVTSEHIKNANSNVPLKCNVCNYKWTPSISNHIHRKTGCRNCAKLAPWSVQKLHIRGQEIYGDLYDYSQVISEYIKEKESCIPVRCTKCNYTWYPTIHHHINQRRGCRRCNRSNGELACQCVLNDLRISCDIEYELSSLPRKRYDFKFTHQNKNYIVEYDGIQHFKLVSLFHEDEEGFKEHQSKDIIKSFHAVNSGYYLIRIDYTQINRIKEHITNAFSLLNDDVKMYYSSISMYKYIHENLPHIKHSGYL